MYGGEIAVVEGIAELVVAVLPSGGLPQRFSGASVAEKLEGRNHCRIIRVVSPDRESVQVVQVADKCLLVGAAAAGNAQLFRALHEVVEVGVTRTSKVGKRDNLRKWKV